MIFDGTILTFVSFWMLYDCLNLEIVSSTFSSHLAFTGDGRTYGCRYRYRTNETVIHGSCEIQNAQSIRCLTRLLQNYLRPPDGSKTFGDALCSRCTAYRTVCTVCIKVADANKINGAIIIFTRLLETQFFVFDI
jgi:hypothetical protein